LVPIVTEYLDRILETVSQGAVVVHNSVKPTPGWATAGFEHGSNIHSWVKPS
jgi:hypothetical protein